MNIYPWQHSAWQHIQSYKGRLHHALLLQGRPGIGKLAFGQALAQAMLCENPADGGLPCGHCPACTWFIQGNHPDYRLLEPDALARAAGGSEEDISSKGEKKGSAQISVLQVRELAGFVNLSTHRNGLRVILVHPAESMNVHAANALLKTLEEPPPGTLIILVSHHPYQLLPTIRSRCQKIAMPAPERAVAVEWLEEQGVNDAELCLVQAGDAPLAALAMGQGNHQEQRRSFLGKLVEIDSITPFTIAEKFHAHDLLSLLKWLQQWIYDLISVRLIGKTRYHLDFASGLQELAGKTNLAKLLAFQRSLVEARRTAHHPLNPQLLLESLLISYADLAHPDGEASYD